MDANARRPPTSISRRSRDARAAAELLTGDEARRIAVKLRLQVSAHMPRAISAASRRSPAPPVAMRRRAPCSDA